MTDASRRGSREAAHLTGYRAGAIANQPLALLIGASGNEEAATRATLAATDGIARVIRVRRHDGTSFEAAHCSLELTDATEVIGHVHVLESLPAHSDHDGRGVTRLNAGVDRRPADPRRPLGSPRASQRLPSAALRYSEAARVRLLRRLVIAQEEERRRIAADLHDHLGQQLTSLRLTLEALRRAAAPDSAVDAALTHADTILVQIDRDIDFLSWELRPAALDDLGLRAVLENYVFEWSRHTGVTARFHADGVGDDPLAAEIGATLYRIAQEALNNVARHARASSVSVLLERRGQTMTLTVEDNGVGFAPPDNTMTMIGVTGMRERAAVIGGVFDIEPTAGGGTTITAQVPLSLTDTIAARPTTWPSERGIRRRRPAGRAARADQPDRRAATCGGRSRRVHRHRGP